MLHQPLARPLLLVLLALLAMLTVSSCRNECDPMEGIAPRAEMQKLVQEISAFGRAQKPGFIVIANNGLDLLRTGDAADSAYLDTIDGLMYESMFYTQKGKDERLVGSEANAVPIEALKFADNYGVRPLVIDFCKEDLHVELSYKENRRHSFLSFASPNTDFVPIPDYADNSLLDFNTDHIDDLYDARNFLHILQYDKMGTKGQVVAKLANSEYDLINMEPYYIADKEVLFDSIDLKTIRNKPNGGRRLVLAYMSTGEAEEYRYYWKTPKPDYIACRSSGGSKNWRVKYWEQAWKDILIGGSDSYLQKIINAGYDGVFLDVVDAYHDFEDAQ